MGKRNKKMGKLQFDDFDPSGKTEISFQEVIRSDGIIEARGIFDRTPFKINLGSSFFESACYKYTVLLMNTQAAMMLFIILANLIVMMAGLKRLRQYQINRFQKIKYLERDSGESHVTQSPTHVTKGDNPPSYNNLQDG